MHAHMIVLLEELLPDVGEKEVGFLSDCDVSDELMDYLDDKSVYGPERYYVPKSHVKVYTTPIWTDFHDGLCRVLVFVDTQTEQRVPVLQFVNYATDSFRLYRLDGIEVLGVSYDTQFQMTVEG